MRKLNVSDASYYIRSCLWLSMKTLMSHKNDKDNSLATAFFGWCMYNGA